MSIDEGKRIEALKLAFQMVDEYCEEYRLYKHNEWVLDELELLIEEERNKK